MFSRPTRMSFVPAISKLFLLVLMVALPALTAPLASAAETPKKVLILSGVDPNLPSVIMVSEIFRSTLAKGSPARVQFFSEALDSLRIPDDKYDQELVKLLQRKYEGEKFDLIFTITQPALKFLLKHKDELFSDTPTVFFLNSEHDADGFELGRNVTGVQGGIELKSALDLALSLHPGTRRVVVLRGAGFRGRFWESLARKEFQSYGTNLEFIYPTNLTIEALRKDLGSLPQGTVVLFISVLADSAGHAYSLPESVSLVAPSSSAPIYVVNQDAFQPGVVGGRMISHEALAKAAAELGLRVLGGEKPQDIPPQNVSSVPIFDRRELRRWGIDEAKLPPGSIVLFKEFTAWQLYKGRIIGAMTLIALQALGIIWLLFTQAKRRQAEQENARLARLAEAERKHLDEVVSNVPGIVWEALSEPGTNKRTTTLVSEYVEKMLGYSVDEWLSTPGFAMTIVLEEDRERAARETQALFERGQDGVLEFRWVTKDGRILWVQSQAAVICDEAGKPVGMRGVTMDITARKLAEESLRQSNERNQAILRAIPDLMFLQSREGTYLDYHAPEPQQLLLPSNVFLGKNMREVLPPELAKRLISCFERAERTGEPQVLEYSLPIQGEERWYEARIVLSSGDKVLSIVRDVTDRRRAGEELRQSEERFRNMADTAPILIWISGPDGLCTYFNQGWLEFTGRTLEQELGDGWVEGVYSEDHARCLEIYHSAYDRRQAFKMEYRLRRADGVFCWIYDVGTPRFSSDGEFLGYIGSCIDISERKRAELEMEQQRSELAHLSRVTMLGELSGSMAHELNQPLTAILSNAQAAQRFLAHDDVDLNEVRDILSDIVKQDKRAGEVIHRLRLLLKKSTVEHQLLDLNDVVSEVLKLVRNDLLNQSVTGQMELAPELPDIVGDRVQLQQVVLNLVMNGCDAIATGPSGDRKLIIRTGLNDGEGICVSVADQGVGLAPDNLEKVFEPFFSTKPHGMGLGLSVCRTIIMAHGGKLWAANNAERGATFYFTIPVKPELPS